MFSHGIRAVLRDNRARSAAFGERVTDFETELYAELGYDLVMGSFAIPSRLPRTGRRLSASDGTSGG